MWPARQQPFSLPNYSPQPQSSQQPRDFYSDTFLGTIAKQNTAKLRRQNGNCKNITTHFNRLSRRGFLPRKFVFTASFSFYTLGRSLTADIARVLQIVNVRGGDCAGLRHWLTRLGSLALSRPWTNGSPCYKPARPMGYGARIL